MPPEARRAALAAALAGIAEIAALAVALAALAGPRPKSGGAAAEYTLGMFGLREHRSLRPSTSKGSLRREGVSGRGREEREVRRACGRRVSETRPKHTVRGRGVGELSHSLRTNSQSARVCIECTCSGGREREERRSGAR